MADGFSLRIRTDALFADLKQVDKDVERATAVGLRQAAAKLRQVAKAKTPVYRGADAVKRPRKGEPVPFNRPVTGLLRASIVSGRLRKQEGGGYAIVTGPTGARARLYAAKIEKLDGYMAAGQAAAERDIDPLMSKAWGTAARGRH